MALRAFLASLIVDRRGRSVPPIRAARMTMRRSSRHIAVATWNLEWKDSNSREAALMRDRLLACQPEVLCITEGYTDFPGGAGHLIEAEADYGYPTSAGRRKAMLWSRQPWTHVDCIGDSI